MDAAAEILRIFNAFQIVKFFLNNAEIILPMISRLARSVSRGWTAPAQARLGAYLDKTGERTLRAARIYVGKHTFPTGDLSWSPLTKPHVRAARRLVDVVVGLAGMTVLAPMTAVVSPLIKLDSPGPIFFSDEREGIGGVSIFVPKFRTMPVAEKSREASPVQKTNPDTWLRGEGSKVTRIGRYLRSCGADELPQLLLVISGKMTLFGLRAKRKDELDSIRWSCHHWREIRKNFPPSLVPAAFFMRGKHLTLEETPILELYYLCTRSFLGDVRLMCRGLATIVAGRHY